MVTGTYPRTDEAGPAANQDETRVLGAVRRILMAGFVVVLLLEAWLAWEFYQSLL